MASIPNVVREKLTAVLGRLLSWWRKLRIRPGANGSLRTAVVARSIVSADASLAQSKLAEEGSYAAPSPEELFQEFLATRAPERSEVEGTTVTAASSAEPKVHPLDGDELRDVSAGGQKGPPEERSESMTLDSNADYTASGVADDPKADHLKAVDSGRDIHEPIKDARGATAEGALGAPEAPQRDDGTPVGGPSRELVEWHPRENRTARRILKRARATPPDHSLVTAGPAVEEPDYLLWNRALVEHCLLDESAENDALLTITPTTLAGALAREEGSRRLPEDAEARFVEALMVVYHQRVLGHGLGVLRRNGPEGVPDCVAFLAGSVLAAYRMQTDEEAVANAYYLRLAEVLGCDLVRGHPQDFDPEEFEALWLFLERWLREEKGHKLAMPASNIGVRRYVAFPLTHVPLRRVDIERLPNFFEWAGYEPGTKVARPELEHDFSRWALGRVVFTNAGMAALGDDRRAAVLTQITHELESWDGSQADSLGRRSANVEILLDIIQRRPELFYLPRRPSAFPAVFDSGMHSFKASEEGWYDPVPLRPEDGHDLADGFVWETDTGKHRLVLRRSGARAIAMRAGDYTGYLSSKSLQLGAPGAALCREDLAPAASDYLSEITNQRCVPLNHPEMPDGWRIFTGVKPIRARDVAPYGLEGLGVAHTANLVPVGGLRLGSRWAWISGASPNLLVAGRFATDQVTIDGERVAIDEEGMLILNGRLEHPGIHVVEASGLVRRIEIVDPVPRHEVREPVHVRNAMALPPGRWTLIGASPGEVAYPISRTRRGAVALCAFTAVWAIEVGAGPGATVLCLQPHIPAPGRMERVSQYGPVGRRMLGWASVIYNAAIRRPQLTSASGDDQPPDTQDAWVAFYRRAREIKRRFRQAQR